MDEHLDIMPEQVVPLLLEQKGVADIPHEDFRGEVVMRCDGVDVCVIEIDDGGWHVTKIACNYPVHGSHPRLQEVRDKIEKWAARTGQQLSQVCPSCDGSGWLPADNERARLIVLFAVTAGIFRGIALPTQQSSQDTSDEDLQHKQESDIVESLLFVRSPSFSDRVARPGPTAPGRALFSQDEDQAKAKEKTDDNP